MDTVTVHGIVLKRRAVGDYDYSVTILTKELGKISAFARGARRMNSRLMASAEPFAFGSFTLYPGKSAYSVNAASIDHYFEDLRTDLAAACYGTYFLELADYYGRENDDNAELLHLLYVSLLALTKTDAPFPKKLIRCVFEIRALQLNGEYPGPPKDISLKEDTVFALSHIVTSPLAKLYTFRVSGDVLDELAAVTRVLRDTFVDYRCKSLEMVDTFEV